jgi:hypothetical protein
MVNRFRRLSPPGASALSSWRLDASPAELRTLLGSGLCGSPTRAKLGAPGTAFDEGVVRATADGGAELHLHGGQGVARALRAWLTERGFREDPAIPEPAGFASEMPTAAAAQAAFLRAESPRAARAWLAFAAEDAPAVLAQGAALDGTVRAQWARERLRHALWAEALESPPDLVIAGPANAGKSSLFNAWLRAARATVADAPGTTRDRIGETLRLGCGAEAWTLRLVDTAGIWDAAEGVDAEAGRITDLTVALAWRVLWVFDAASPPGPRAREAFARARPHDLCLLHRTDLGSFWNPAEMRAGPWLEGSLRNEGPACIARIEAALLASLGPMPEDGAWLPLGAGLRRHLSRWAGAQPGGG